MSTMEPTWVCARFSAYVLGLCMLCSCGTPNSQSEGVSDSLVCSWDPLPSLALLHLVKPFCVAILERLLFSAGKQMRSESGVGEIVRETGRKVEMGNCSWCTY